MERAPAQPQSQPQLQQYVYADDEINLYDIWHTLVRRRLLIVGTAIAVIIASAGYSFLQTPTYAVELKLWVGEKPSMASDEGREWIERPKSLVVRLNEVVIPQSLSAQTERFGATDISMPPLSGVEAEVLDEEAGLLLLSAVATDANIPAVKDFLSRIAELIVAEHDSQLTNRTDALKDQIMFLRAEVERLERRENDVQPNGALIGDAARGVDASAVFALLIDRMLDNVQLSERANLQLRRLELESALIGAGPTFVARPAGAVDQQGRSVGMMVGIGAILGLMLGVFGAFGREFLENAAAHRQEQLSK